MVRFARIRDRLPSLYRPEDDATDLLSRFLQAIGGSLDRVDGEAAEVMQAHWLEFADRALYSPYVRRSREVQGRELPRPGDADLLLFPFIDDLARLGALLALLPWRDPLSSREVVEAYRRRIRRIVALYRNGLGTVAALRAVVEAQLPVDVAAPPGLQDRPFTLEEFAPLIVRSQMIRGRGAPLDKVGPLMRWTLNNDGLAASPATVYVQGVAPQPQIAATEQPLIELYAADAQRVRLGIAYDGILAPDQTLRLRPAYSSWLGRDDGVHRAESLPTESNAADPTAPGLWQPAPGAPGDPVAALLHTRERSLWAAVNAAAGGELWRFDGAWTRILDALPVVHALAEDGDDLLLGTGQGLLRLPLYPNTGPLTPVPAVADLAGPAVFSILRTMDGQWCLGTETGLARLEAADALAPFGLGADPATETPVYALHQDRTGVLYLGTELGLFQYQPSRDHWYWFEGRETSDQRPDWRRFFPELSGAERQFPAAGDVFLPPVRSVLRGPDASLWIGTDNGIARYTARAVRGLSYTTLLEALPDLASGRVTAIREDERGLVWFATEQGLFRYDGRDWWQVQGNVLVRLALGSAAPADPTVIRLWRFDRAAARWEFLDAGSSVRTPFAGAPRGIVEAPVRDLIWTDQVAADLGTWDGMQFTVDPAAVPGPLRMRFKPDDTRVINGGLAAVPRLPPGPSKWRYLALEPAAVPTPRTFPAWTVEGRLLPPPPDRAAPEEGRYGEIESAELSRFDDAVFAYPPAARVWFAWEARRPLAVLARLGVLAPGERLDPAVLDRVRAGIEQVRPAGVRALLAVDRDIVRGR